MLDEGVYNEQVGRELIGAVGDLAVRAGWASYDSGDQTGLARQMYVEALLLAEQAEDDALAVHALASMSLQSVQRARDGRPGLAREAVRLSVRAAELARGAPAPRLHALIAAREAIAHAALGDGHGFRTAITRAWRELERGPAPEDPLWLRFVVPAEISVHEAKGLTYLGDPRAAVEAYRTSMEDPDLSHRNRACYHSQLAAALARCGDVTGALGEGLAVLPILEGRVASLRTLRELQPVRSAAEQAGAEEFCARFDAAAQTLVA
jgi:hypothetical protein